MLVGRDLIKSAEIRKQIQQIEKYNTAMHTFRAKYGGLPGDLKDSENTQLGFFNAKDIGTLNGDGFISGGKNGGSVDRNYVQQTNSEPLWFWNDLSRANLVDGSFGTVDEMIVYYGVENSNSPETYFPTAALGDKTFVGVIPFQNQNYFVLAHASSLLDHNGGGGYFGFQGKVNSIPVFTAFTIDSKIDDGMPETGAVKAWWEIDSDFGTNVPAYGTSAISRTSTTCFDNNNVIGTRVYSIAYDGGNGKNCGLIFRFQ